MKRVVLFIAVLFAAFPSSAHAAVVALNPVLGVVFYEAGIGEVNDLQVTYSSGTFTIVDLGAVIEAGDGCSSVGIHEVACSAGVGEASFELGDLNDTAAFLDSASPFVHLVLLGEAGRDDLTLCLTCDGGLVGGGGADTLHGGDGRDTLRGGRGSDTIMGAGGNDHIYGGPGNDTIVAGPGGDALLPGPGDDTVGGRSGTDTVLFFARRLPTGVTADLRTGLATGGAGNDTLTSIECLFGTSYEDRLWGDSDDECFAGLGGTDVIHGRGGRDSLRGDASHDRLFGGAGRDVIEGGAGDDLIVGGAGRDRLRGNEGDDRLRAKDGVSDRVGGGSGFDSARVDPSDITRLIEKLVF